MQITEHCVCTIWWNIASVKERERERDEYVFCQALADLGSVYVSLRKPNSVSKYQMQTSVNLTY